MRKIKNSIVLVLIGIAAVLIITYTLSTKPIISSPVDEINQIEQTDLLQITSDCACHRHLHYLIETTVHNELKVHVIKNKSSNTIIQSTTVLNKTAFNELNFTCSLYSVLKRGAQQRVISFSLYGKENRYYVKLKDIVQQIKHFYPNWLVRIYHDDSIDPNIKCEIECLFDSKNNSRLLDNVDFCNINEIPMSYARFRRKKSLKADYIHSMMWRWLPLADHFVDVFSSRDLDSFIFQREVDSVNAWLESEKLGHIMRDHPYHTFKILGGMWGIKTKQNRGVSNRLFEQMLDRRLARRYLTKNGTSLNGLDQWFLRHYVYRFLVNDAVIHDSFYCRYYTNSRPWPSRRMGDCFVGIVSPCYENSTSFHTCPKRCRPPEHLDWKTC